MVLKGLVRKEQQALIDAYNANNKNSILRPKLDSNSIKSLFNF
jgi:hypothetical protein